MLYCTIDHIKYLILKDFLVFFEVKSMNLDSCDESNETKINPKKAHIYFQY